MNKIWYVAKREFLATVATKGFLISVLITPALLALLIFVMPRLMKHESPPIDGEIVLVDPTGEVAAGVRTYLAPEALAARREEAARAAAQAAAEKLGPLAAGSSAAAVQEQAAKSALGEVPKLALLDVPPAADLEQVKEPLKSAAKNAAPRLAVVVVHPDAVRPAAGKETYGSYDLYVRAKLDDRLEDEIKDALRHSIVAARARDQRLDLAAVERLTQVQRTRSITVTAKGERRTNEVLNALLPGGFMVLLLVSVLSSGQYLMTTTVEEKSNRVVEVLLSAVSPLQLMTGKILGQMAVGFVILVLYAGLGIAAIVNFAMLGMLDPRLFLFLLLFYVIAYFVFASLMAAIGAAVNEMREAQSLMTPLMVLIMIPWILWMPITRSPNSAFSTVLSFVPPINSFVMLLRMTSSSPPPAWQVGLSIGVGIASVFGALWFASKVFRIGLLMYGKPPNFATLVRWARMA